MATRGRSITRLNIDRRHSAYACIRAVASTIQFLFSTGRSSSRCTVLSIESRAIMFEKANCLSQIIDFYSRHPVSDDQCFCSSIHYLGFRANEIRTTLLSIIKKRLNVEIWSIRNIFNEWEKNKEFNVIFRISMS